MSKRTVFQIQIISEVFLSSMKVLSWEMTLLVITPQDNLRVITSNAATSNRKDAFTGTDYVPRTDSTICLGFLQNDIQGQKQCRINALCAEFTDYSLILFVGNYKPIVMKKM